MSPRRDIREALERMAFAAEILGEPSAGAWSSAAWAVRNLEGDPAAMLADGSLAKVRGIGARALEVIADVLAGREPAALTALVLRIPPGLFQLRRIRGLGAKKIKALHEELGITSLAELEQACRENRLLALSGFGKKTQASALEQIALLAGQEGKHRRDEAQRLLVSAEAEVRAAWPGVSVEAAGDLRRGRDVVERLALVVIEPDESLLEREPPPVDPRIEIVRATPSRRGVALLRATGPIGYLEALEARAAERGLALGLGALDGADGEVRATPDEQDVADALLIHLDPPERRGAGPLLPKSGAGPDPLVRREDLRGALHNHTVASDGTATLAEMRAAAARWGLSYLGINEHSEAAFYARGLDAERLRAQREDIAKENEREGPTLLSGIESDILEDGALDFEDEVLRPLEVVVASVHKRGALDKDAMTARLVRAIRSPWTDVLGHPTGRLLFGRPSFACDLEAVLDACRDVGCAIELNGSPQRLDLFPDALAMAKERGVLVSIAADAHATSELDQLEHGLAVARHAGLRAEDVLNTRPLSELRAWLRARRVARGVAPA